MSSGKEIRDLNKIYMEAVYGQSPEKEEAKRRKDDDLAGSPKQYTLTAADKKGNTPAYQKYKAGAKNVKTGKPLYKAADHLKNEGYEEKKKGEVLSALDRDKRPLSKKEKDKIANKVVTSKGDTSKSDDRYAYEELKQVRRLTEKVNGEPIQGEGTKGTLKKELKDLKKGAETLKGKNVAKADQIADEYIPEKKDKDTPDQVKAVISYDKARKATDDATYDTEHGDKEQAKKEKDYAKWQRDQGAEDAQKSGHPWEHAKGSTREKEGKKSEKHAHIKDSYDRESQLWDEVAINLTELHELGGVKFKVVPFDLEEDDKWIKGAVKRPGAFTKKAKESGMSVQQFAAHVDANKDKYSTRTERQANLAQTFASMKKEGADYESLSEFLIKEGADEEAVNHIMANWLFEGLVAPKGVDSENEVNKATRKAAFRPFKNTTPPKAKIPEGYQRNPEKGEAEERRAERDRKASGRMPPRGDKRREDFEKWYAANVR